MGGEGKAEGIVDKQQEVDDGGDGDDVPSLDGQYEKQIDVLTREDGSERGDQTQYGAGCAENRSTEKTGSCQGRKDGDSQHLTHRCQSAHADGAMSQYDGIPLPVLMRHFERQ